MENTSFFAIKIASTTIISFAIVVLAISTFSLVQRFVVADMEKSDKYIKINNLVHGESYTGDYLKNFIRVKDVEALEYNTERELIFESNKVYLYMGLSLVNSEDMLFLIDE